MGISSLGIGSSILTQDVIDQLKTYDENVQIKPITTKIAKAEEKQTALSTLQSLMITTKSYVSDFSDELTYLDRTATSSSSDVSLDVIGGTNAQSATINVSKLAKNDIWESNGFQYSTSLVNGTGATQNLKLEIGSTSKTSFDISVSANATVQDLANAINSSAGAKVTASVVNTGESSNPYRLVIKSDTNGVESKITLTDTSLNTGFNTSNDITGSNVASSAGSLLSGDIMINGIAIPAASLPGGADANANGVAIQDAINNKKDQTGVTATYDSGTGKISLSTGTNYGTIDVATTANGEALSGFVTKRSQGNHLQTGQDAEFTYNGMSMKRNSNTITDIAVGLTINLNSANSKDISLSITQNLENVSTLATQFVEAYNAMQSQLNALTKYTKGATTQGIFVGVGEISSVESDLMSSFTNSVAVGGKSYSLMDYGFNVDKDGKMSLDTTIFNDKLNENPSLLEKVFRGTKTYTDSTYTANMAASTADGTTNLNDILINGISLPKITTLSTNTAVQNAQLFADAINKIEAETGAKATVDSSGHLKLTSSYGGRVTVSTTTNGALYSGLSDSTSVAQAITNSVVAIGSSKTEDGIFTMMEKSFNSLFNDKKTGSLNLYEDELDADIIDYTARQETVQKSIDDRYEIMQKRFQMYDAIIAKMTQQASTLTQMINAANNT